MEARVDEAAAVLQPAGTSRAATVAAYAYALLAGACIAHFLLGIPIQVSDSFGNMLKLETTWRQLLINEFTQRAYLRPFLWAELKLVYDASGGNYFPWFRGVHAAQVIALAALYVPLVRPRGWRDAALLPLGIAILFGMHTFKGTVFEAFPVNTFLTILLCCLAAANLALTTHRWWTDVLAVVLFVVAALTVESGLLVAVIFVGAALVGARGVSRPALAAIVALLAGYFALRFGYLNVGSPGLAERSSGYGFRFLDPPELVARFGDNPLPFYAYNVVTSAVSVLLSEPRAGVFGLLYGVTINDPYPPAVVNVVASTCATALIAVYAWRRRRAWLARQFDHDDRLVLIFLAVLAANATISYPYTKDVIMSPAGAFYAVAVFAAARGLLPRVAASRSVLTAALVLFCATLGASWSLRAMGLPLGLREASRKVRNEWADVDHWIVKQDIRLDARGRALLDRLRGEALFADPAPPRLVFEYSWLVDGD